MKRFISGFVIGCVGIGVMVVVLMPKMMIVTHESRYDFDTTIGKIEQKVTEIGWTHKGTTNMTGEVKKAVKKSLGTRVSGIKICKAEYAYNILKDEKSRFVSCLMPCSISVWEGDDRMVYISKMNTGLMGKMFGGIIAEIMGDKVGSDEKAILKDIIKS